MFDISLSGLCAVDF